jgi:hypothetical protein
MIPALSRIFADANSGMTSYKCVRSSTEQKRSPPHRRDGSRRRYLKNLRRSRLGLASLVGRDDKFQMKKPAAGITRRALLFIRSGRFLPETPEAANRLTH